MDKNLQKSGKNLFYVEAFLLICGQKDIRTKKIMSQFSIFGLIFEDFCSYVLLSKTITMSLCSILG
jgi:hypothetical protein